jgi:hypothetical protein
VDALKAPEPELILWQNYNVSKESRTYRRIGVAIVGLFLLGLCLTAVILDQYFTDQTVQDYNTSDCGTQEITMLEAYKDSQLGKDYQLGLLGCYCMQQFKLIK